jgi:homocysteine S-methyltransferase
MARSIKPLTVTRLSANFSTKISQEQPCKEPVPLEKKSAFAKKLSKGEWVTSVEIVPPRGFGLSSTIKKARQCKDAGIDAINIPDGPRASSRISPMITAQQILTCSNIEPILHFCTRDKNLIGIQADLLGCAAVGIHNILFITGDPPKLGDYPFASAVFDVDSIGVVDIQRKLNCGIDLGGKSFEPPTQALIGVGADPSALDMKRELERTQNKIKTGAEFIITQPVFDVDALFRFMEKLHPLPVPLIAGIWPLASYRNAEFMHNEVPGVNVPEHAMARMAKWSTKEDQRKEGISIARESIERIHKNVQGIQVSAPFGNVNTAIAVMEF